jgi:hypothetical protein
MLRHLCFIAVCACIVASVGCDGGLPTPPTPTPPPPGSTVTVEFGGRVVNADAGGPVGNVRVSVQDLSFRGTDPAGWSIPKDTATSGGDGTFTLQVNLPTSWSFVYLKLTGPPGYDDRYGSLIATGTQCGFGPCWVPADRPDIRMYPTLAIRPGESIEVRVDDSIVYCGWDGYACRRVVVAASPGQSVELEVVSHDSNNRMALGLASSPDGSGGFVLEPDMSVSRLIVPPGRTPYVIGGGTATLTAR